MKTIGIFLIASFVMIACQKEPTACIEVLPTTTVTVFDEVTLKSCSEDAAWYEWEIEEFQNGAQTYQYSLDEETTFVWDEAGLFDVYLTVQSENMKKQTSESAQITVNDICYTCTNGTSSSDVCYSDFDEKSSFDAALSIFTGDGFTCSQN